MEYNYDSLHGRNVLVTGGSGAIGQEIAKAFLSVGAKVTLWAHREIDVTLTEELDVFQIVELRDRNEIMHSYEEAVIKTGGYDVLVNCAGYTFSEKSEEYPIEEWDKTFAINVSAPFLLGKLVASDMIVNHTEGSIINITSIGSMFGFPNNPAYVSSKGALEQLTRAFALDFGKYGIRVNAVAPGYTVSKMTAGSYNDSQMRVERTNHTMLNRWAMPEDIAGMVLFLASDLSKYITGQNIFVDGGWNAKGL